MKNKSEDKKAAAKAYVDTQLDTIRKHGTEVKLSTQRYEKIVRQVAKASS